MEFTVIKSTAKTFQYGYVDEYGQFFGITVKGTDMTYDPLTGMPDGGTLRWMVLNNDIADSGLPRGNYSLTNFDETDVATLAAGEINWVEPEGFFELYAIQSAPKLTIERNQSDFVGSDGNDTIIVNALSYSGGVIDGGFGNDELRGSLGNDTLLGGEGDDSLYGGNLHASYGTNAFDLLDGGAGDDRIYGGGTDDSLRGGAGNDRMYGGDGSDTLLGDSQYFQDYGVTNSGNDVMFGGNGTDYIFGHSGDDRLRGDGGDDTLYGGLGADDLYGGDGNDQLIGDDAYVAGNTADRLFGGEGDDFLVGGAGDDRIFGGKGNDSFSLDTGNEMANGGAGNDTFYSHNGGTDVLTGGAGADHFIFDIATTEQSTIRDFSAAEDIFSLASAQTTTQQQQYDAFMAGATQANQNVVWTDGSATIVLKRLDLEDLTLDNFVDVEGYVIATY